MSQVWLFEALTQVTVALGEIHIEHKSDVVVPLPDFSGVEL